MLYYNMVSPYSPLLAALANDTPPNSSTAQTGGHIKLCLY
jgi:hypothetical protein